MKALAEIADIYPRMTSIHDSSLFDDSFAMDFINYGDKIIYCAMYLYVLTSSMRHPKLPINLT